MSMALVWTLVSVRSCRQMKKVWTVSVRYVDKLLVHRGCFLSFFLFVTGRAVQLLKGRPWPALVPKSEESSQPKRGTMLCTTPGLSLRAAKRYGLLAGCTSTVWRYQSQEALHSCSMVSPFVCVTTTPPAIAASLVKCRGVQTGMMVQSRPLPTLLRFPYRPAGRWDTRAGPACNNWTRRTSGAHCSAKHQYTPPIAPLMTAPARPHCRERRTGQ